MLTCKERDVVAHTYNSCIYLYLVCCVCFIGAFMFLNTLFIHVQMIAPLLVLCLYILRHLGCNYCEGRCTGAPRTAPIWNLVVIGKGVVQTWCILFWSLYRRCLYNDTLFSREEHNCSAVQKRCSEALYEQHLWRNILHFPM